MNKLSTSKRSQIVHLLVEGNSLRATARLAHIDYNTVLSLLVKVGDACAEYQYMALRNLPCKRMQVDEIWSFVGCKQKNTQKVKNPRKDIGDIWTFTSLCPDTKIVPTWLVGHRDSDNAAMFIKDLASRMAGRIQLTSDGFKSYENAVNGVFGANVDFAMLIKLYDGRQHYIGSEKHVITGNPKLENVSTSLVERQNLTMRMGIRRFTRKTNAFSKKVENHASAVALHFMYYNFCRIHKSLKVTPAMEAGVSRHVWELEEVIGLAYKDEVATPRGAYRSKWI
jgi:IS1 family transposase